MYKSDILLKRSTNILVLSDFVCVCVEIKATYLSLVGLLLTLSNLCNNLFGLWISYL